MVKELYKNFNISSNFDYGISEEVDYIGLPFKDDSMYNEFKNNQNIKSVSNISSSVTNMVGAFAYCNNITSVTNIPSNATLYSEISSIYGYGYDTTQGSSESLVYKVYLIDETPTMISAIILKDPWNENPGCQDGYKITSISENTFNYIDESNNEYIATRNTSLDQNFDNLYPRYIETAFFKSGLTTTPEFSNNTTDITYAFYHCDKLQSVNNLPDSIQYMWKTFANCTNLTSVILPNNATDVTYTFEHCSSLVDAPDMSNLNNITGMEGTFRYDYNLTNVSSLPNNLISLSDTFSGCSSLVNAPAIPNSVTSMGYAFGWCSNLVNAPEIPDSVTSLNGTFISCSSLVNAPEIPNSVTDMSYAFSGCDNLVNISEISNNVTNMCYTFQGCSNLVNAPVIPNSVTDMDNTFISCFNLVNAPDMNNATSITNMNQTFSYCYNLSGDIFIRSENITDANECFVGSETTKNVYIPFTYENGVNTLTYNSFINAGYTTDGTVCGVYLKDIKTS